MILFGHFINNFLSKFIPMGNLKTIDDVLNIGQQIIIHHYFVQIMKI